MFYFPVTLLQSARTCAINLLMSDSWIFPVIFIILTLLAIIVKAALLARFAPSVLYVNCVLCLSFVQL